MAFVTFETQEGAERCIKFAKKGTLTKSDKDKLKGKNQFSILGENIGINLPSEPTDILWENLCVDND